jgi:hypothetical protein
MKKINFKILFLPVLIILCFSNCNKKLDETLYSVSTNANFYQNADQVMAAYVLPYAYMQTHVYQVHFQDAEFVTDEACVPVVFGYIDQEGQWLRFHQHTWTSRDFWILLEWQDLYQAIGYCNNFIDNTQNLDVSTMELQVPKEQMIAEIRMVRALHYYWALSEFGNIPIVEHVSKAGDPGPTNSTPADAFAFIEKEIKESIPNLSEKGDDNWYGHFTKTAAYALLAKLYLNAKAMTGQEHWQDCIAACDAVIQSGLYQLDEYWNDPFKVHNESSNENIYVVPFDANNAQGFNFIEQDIHENITVYKYAENPGDYSVDYGWRKISTQESFFDLYKPNDYRINQWIVGPQTYTDENGDEQPVPNWSDEPMDITPQINDLFDANDNEGVMNIKYEIEYNFGNYGNNGFVNMNNDMVIFRYAEILMMKAECLMRLNGNAATPEAVSLVNTVRARSFAANDPDAKYTTATLTMDELLNERGREFAYEMFRREDLIRFGKFNEAWWEKPASDPHYNIFPIPFDIVTANPALKQNLGY